MLDNYQVVYRFGLFSGQSHSSIRVCQCARSVKARDFLELILCTSKGAFLISIAKLDYSNRRA